MTNINIKISDSLEKALDNYELLRARVLKDNTDKETQKHKRDINEAACKVCELLRECINNDYLPNEAAITLKYLRDAYNTLKVVTTYGVAKVETVPSNALVETRINIEPDLLDIMEVLKSIRVIIKRLEVADAG